MDDIRVVSKSLHPIHDVQNYSLLHMYELHPRVSVSEACPIPRFVTEVRKKKKGRANEQKE